MTASHIVLLVTSADVIESIRESQDFRLADAPKSELRQRYQALTCFYQVKRKTEQERLTIRENIYRTEKRFRGPKRDSGQPRIRNVTRTCQEYTRRLSILSSCSYLLK